MGSVYRLMLGTQLTKGRIAALTAVGLVGVLIGMAIGVDDVNDAEGAAFSFVDAYGLGLLVPSTALVFAAAAFGEPAEDGTLVYLWLRPVARWRLVAASFAASVSVAIPFAVLPTVVAAGLTRTGRDLPMAALLAAALATTAYCGLFLGLGLLVRRALVWGLAYVLIWEGFVARSGTAAARLSVLSYARSLMAELANHEPPRLAASSSTAVIVPVAVALAGLAFTTYSLRRADVK